MAIRRAQAEIGIIGGSGLYEMEGLERVREVRPATPFGRPSDALILGTIDGVKVAFLSRHGRGHRITPSEINYRANIYALKSVGVTRIISVSAVGSMKEAVRPGDVLLPDQFIDMTKRRIGTFFEQGVVAHVAFADPICSRLSGALFKAAQGAGVMVHRGGVYLCIEGPQFSSRGESLLYRRWEVDVIGMTNLPEAKLAREAEVCYATLALPTDYDCWHATEESVSVDAIIATLKNNVALAKRIIRAALSVAAEPRACLCATALEHAVLTAPQAIPQATRKRLGLLLARHLKNREA
ncbi:MAG: S-methyl-5'-thioadenosine phosphorylase [Nitrospirae bacterium]|nr:MAG: S-methyl-5'-thioadenosine phosphorylase [Nitrospirota bacterium]